jgi:enamine deaminase RidA (YjgF/YER057c/UK114 family)
MTHMLINPESLGAPKGYSNGVLAAAGGKLLFVAGQVAWNREQEVVSSDFAEQFGQALENVLTVVTAAGGLAEHITRLTIYVTDKNEYVAALRGIGESYRRIMGRHFPAMALLEIKALLEQGAKIEIEATAVLPA